MWKYLMYLNVFQYCKFLKLVGNVMVLLVLGIVGFIWYTMVVAVYGPKLVRGPALASFGSGIMLIAFNTLVAMLLWAYFAAVSADPGSVPAGWHPFQDEQTAQHELERMSYSGHYADRGDPRRPRYCKRCKAWKPERAHHCSVMGRCVLKMDHYCIWVVNCVGLFNYKFFVQFMAYTFLASMLALGGLIRPMLDFFGPHPETASGLAFIAMVLSAAFTFSLAGFLIMHFQLVAANCTTIEMYEKERMKPWPYDKGLRRNFEDVLGKSPRSWLLPWHTPEDRRQLLDSCLSTRLLCNNYTIQSSNGGQVQLQVHGSSYV